MPLLRSKPKTTEYLLSPDQVRRVSALPLKAGQASHAHISMPMGEDEADLRIWLPRSMTPKDWDFFMRWLTLMKEVLVAPDEYFAARAIGRALRATGIRLHIATAFKSRQSR